MRLVIIFGPPAVGKKTVGYELCSRTKFKVFHNHMTIDLISNFFDYGTEPFWNLVSEFRYRIIEELSKIKDYDLIFTFVWAFNDENDKKTIDDYRKTVELYGGEIFFVELQSTLEERLKRNRSETRFNNRKKIDLDLMERTLIEWEDTYKMQSEGQLKQKNYLKIDNTNLSPSEVADMIVEHFKLNS